MDSWNGDLRAEERQQLERVIKRAAFRREMESLSAEEAEDFEARGMAAPVFESERAGYIVLTPAIRSSIVASAFSHLQRLSSS